MAPAQRKIKTKMPHSRPFRSVKFDPAALQLPAAHGGSSLRDKNISIFLPNSINLIKSSLYYPHRTS